MKRWILAILTLSLTGLSGVSGAEPVAKSITVKPVTEVQGLPRKIGFGSCANQNKPQPILETIVKQQPELFIYLGDNIYGDSRDINVLRQKYNLLGAKPEFQALRKNVAVLSIWDDHDYGENDSGKDYPIKEASRELFFEFWQIPTDSPRRQHPGIYGSHYFTEKGRTLQVILLDTRFFRDRLLRNPRGAKPEAPFKNDYRPDSNPDKTLLGAEQWEWLEGELKKPADIRLVASSIQFGHEYNGYESWTNLPLEQQKFIDLIRKTGANGVLMISGDVHWAEISKRDIPEGYPLYDVTASGITEDWSSIEPNKYRVGEAVRDNHFGLLEFDWDQPDPVITLQIIDRPGTVRRSEKVPLSTLRFSTKQ